MHNLDLLKKRLNVLGGNAEQRMIKEKLKSLEKALLYSYQAEDIEINNKQYRVLINNSKLNLDYDDKIISAPNSVQMRVGDTFLWTRTDSYWIVYLQEKSEDAYFRGHIRAAEHTLHWKTEYGIEKSIRIAVRGPVETTNDTEKKSTFLLDSLNLSLEIYVPKTRDTEELKKYDRVTIANKPWKIVTIDSISEEGIIQMYLIEDYLNEELDTKELVSGKVETIVDIASCFDEVTQVAIGKPIPLWSEILINGQLDSEITNEAKYYILYGDAIIENNSLLVNSESEVTILLTAPNINIKKEYKIIGVNTITDFTTDLEIIGETQVKSYGSTIYSIRKNDNGIPTIPTGTWIYEQNSSLFKVIQETNEILEIEWVMGASGKLFLKYQEGTLETEQEIIVESLL